MSYRLVALAKEAGFRGLFAGLGPRMIMTAGLVSGQFLLYGGVKEGLFCFMMFCRVCGRQMLIWIHPALGAPPGLEIHKE